MARATYGQMSNQTNKTQAKVHQRSLCTSEVVCGAPGSKEDAKEAPQAILEAVASTGREQLDKWQSN